MQHLHNHLVPLRRIENALYEMSLTEASSSHAAFIILSGLHGHHLRLGSVRSTPENKLHLSSG